VVALGLRLKDILGFVSNYSFILGYLHSAYCSGKSRSSGSSANSASSSLWSSSTAACFPFHVRLDDAWTCPSGDRLFEELDMPSTCVLVYAEAHFLHRHGR
jgi:hypothetical protein